MGDVTNKEIIARRVARELKDGDYVNLGVGIPSLVVNYLPEGVSIMVQGEDGVLGMGAHDENPDGNFNCVDAGGKPVKTVSGAAFFDSAEAFAMARGGHLDCTVLGALQVDASGNLANWWIPGVRMPGMGGAMDIVAGARKVIVAMEHTSKGRTKIKETCDLPLTAPACVNLIVTEMGVFEITDKGIMMKEYNPSYSVSDIQKVTEAKLIISPDLKKMF